MAAFPLIPVITDVLLVRRAETMKHAIESNNQAKLERVLENTLMTIAARESSEVPDKDLEYYIDNVELATMMFYCGVEEMAIEYLRLAACGVMMELSEKIPELIMRKKLEKVSHDIGKLSVLPNDVMRHIGKLM